MGIEEPIKQILLRDWDPIGIGDDPYAQTEYDSYAMQILGMLYRGVTEKQLTDFLDNVVTERMELPRNSETSKSVAKKLLSLKIPKSIP